MDLAYLCTRKMVKKRLCRYVAVCYAWLCNGKAGIHFGMNEGISGLSKILTFAMRSALRAGRDSELNAEEWSVPMGGSAL